MARLLMACGCDCSRVEDLIRSRKNTTNDWFYSFIVHPQKLSVLCRNSIRNHLHEYRRNAKEIEHLPVPAKIKSFLSLEDVLSEFSNDDESDDSYDSYTSEDSDSSDNGVNLIDDDD